MLTLFANASTEHLWLTNLGQVGMWLVIGALLLAATLKVIDWITPGDLLTEVFERGNIALALTTIGGWIGTACIVGGVLTGEGSGDGSGIIPLFANTTCNNVANALIFVSVGMFAMVGLYKAFDYVTPKWNFGELLVAKQNTAAGVLLGGLFVAVGLLVGFVLHG